MPNFSGMNLASAISTALRSGETPSYVGGGVLGVVVPSDWTVCFAKPSGHSVTFYAAKDCSPDSNSQSGPAAPSPEVSGFVDQNLQAAENNLSSGGLGYNEIGGGDLGIFLPSDWTVCYATNVGGATDLYAAKSCTPQPAS
jgi:hypothetical protein